MMRNRATYEYFPIAPAVMHAFAWAVLATLIMTAIMLAIPFSGWMADQPIAVTPAMFIAELNRLWVNRLGPSWMGFDIIDQVQVRCIGIALCALLTCLSCFVIRKAATPIADRRLHYDGRRLITDKHARTEAAQGLLARKGKTEKDMPLLAAGLSWPRGWQVLNLLIMGAIGSGKTRILLYLIENLIGWMKRAPDGDHGLFVYDTTGEILAGLPLDDAEIAVISAEPNTRWGWSMSKDAPSVGDCESVAMQRAQTLRDGGLWEKGAATLDAGAMILAHVEHKNWSAPELYEISLRNPVALKAAWENHYPPAAKLIEVDPESGELTRTAASFVITWRANVLRTLRPLAEAWRNIPAERMFSFADWLAGDSQQPRTVVVQRSGRYADISAAWISMVMDTIAGRAGDPNLPVSQTRQRIFVLDEAPTLGHLRRWPELLDTGRNKGLSTIAVCQDLTQFRIVYRDIATSILQRFRLKIICEQTPGPDAEEISKVWIGERRVIDWTNFRADAGAKSDMPKPETTRIVPAEHLSDRLGVYGGAVHALLVGLPNVCRLEWPVKVWNRRR